MELRKKYAVLCMVSLLLFFGNSVIFIASSISDSLDNFAIEQQDATESENENESRIPVPVEEEEHHNEIELNVTNLAKDEESFKLTVLYNLNWKNIDSKILTPPPKSICV